MLEADGSDPAAPEALAGEFALGVLEGEELAAAQRQLLADRDFARAVEWWRLRLACMAEAAPSVEPSDNLWPAIERRLDGWREGDGGAVVEPLRAPARRGLAGWRLGSALAGAAAVAAALTAILVMPQGTGPVTPIETPGAAASEQLIAQVQSEDGALSLAGVIEPNTRQIRLSLAGFAPPEGQAAELWVVPAGGAPQSLGLIPASGTYTRELTEAEAAALVDGALLAVTYEPTASAPHAAPSSAILVAGGLTRV